MFVRQNDAYTRLFLYMPIRVAILTGGDSSEREIALLSAEGIRSILDITSNPLIFRES